MIYAVGKDLEQTAENGSRNGPGHTLAWALMTTLEHELAWSSWYPHRGASRNQNIPAGPGLYRIRRVGQQRLDYVGQTGRSLRGRLGQLQGVYGDIMPYGDPHTAGPGFWALRQDEGRELEVSVAEVRTGVATRKGYECVVISEHRVEHGLSPTLNFGRMPHGWTKSSGNTVRLAAAGRRFRGRQDPSAVRVPDAPSPPTLRGDPREATWLGLPWSDLTASPPPRGSVGVYRAMRSNANGLIYVGQGRIVDRIKNHRAKADDPTHAQYAFFIGDLAWHWVALPDMHRTQRLEIENDLIAGHMLVHRRSPGGQFLG